MHQVINPVDPEVTFGNPANLVDVADASRRILDVRFQVAFSIVVLRIAFCLLIHFGIKKGFIGPGLRHNTAWPFGQMPVAAN